MNTQNTQLKEGKLGFVFWFLTCFLGSILLVEIESYFFNNRAGFHISFADRFMLWFVMTLLSLIVSSPSIILIYVFLRNGFQMNRVLLFGLAFSCVSTYFLTHFLTTKHFEAFYVTGSYHLVGSIFTIFYLRIESRSNSDDKSIY